MEISKKELLDILTNLPDPNVWPHSQFVLRRIETKTVINKGTRCSWYTLKFVKKELAGGKEWVFDLPIPADTQEEPPGR